MDEEGPDAGTDGRQGGYESLAARADELDGWESPWGENPLQEAHAWPATRELLPDPADDHVLDAGCGVGDHAAWLLEAGASVTALDASRAAVEAARERFGTAENLSAVHADLTAGVPLADGTVDGVLSHLVLDHVPDLRPVFAEFERVLAPGGWAVTTTVHPVQYYLAYEAVDSYYDCQPVEVTWDPPVTSYHRPLSAYVEAVQGAGLDLEALVEPEPPAAYVEAAADEWNPDRRPQILCLRVRAPGPE